MELSPRTEPTADEATPRRRHRRLPAVAVLVVLVLVGGFVMVKALGNATTFYRNVDEAVAQKAQLGTKTFRLQGTVVPGTIKRTADGVDFTLIFNGVELPVSHVGDPPQLFKENEAVLLEGHFAPDGTMRFDSDLMIVKHSSQYIAKEGDRLKQAQEGGQVPPVSTVTTVGGGS